MKQLSCLFLAITLGLGTAVAQPLDSDIPKLLEEKNYAAAERKLATAADSGNLYAKYLLGVALMQGKYFPHDGARAIAYLRDASAKGDGQATYFLAQLAAQSDLQSPEVHRLVELAAAQRHPLAMHIHAHLNDKKLLLTFPYADFEMIIPMKAPPMPSDWSASIQNGEINYKGSCVACHELGVANAPKLTDRKRWVKIRKKGVEKLVQNAIEGFNIHPPRGGDYSLSAEDLRDAVIYMLDTASRK
ncbi:c-type cytochrome [Pseudoduganella violaceinigra]|uniref:c-type cytochrome n=1 Tax=Pseudoduganella violaceinigra TaxID=246602 RepID=UPI000685647B|nr:c-type cytochrome [Pseudoduganella violaceinigra]